MAFRWIHVVAGICGWAPVLLQLRQRAGREDLRCRLQEEGHPGAHAAGALLVPLGRRVHLGHRRAAAGLVYYMRKAVSSPQTRPWATAPRPASRFAILLVGFAIYESSGRRSPRTRRRAWPSRSCSSSRCIFALERASSRGAPSTSTSARCFGTIMAANVWMRIWPASGRSSPPSRPAPRPDAALAATAGLRSKHNTYMSVPLIFTMIWNHYASCTATTSSVALPRGHGRRGLGRDEAPLRQGGRARAGAVRSWRRRREVAPEQDEPSP